MDLSTIKRIGAYLRPQSAGRYTRLSLAAALICVFLGNSVLAQDTLEFIDPLNDERTRIEKNEAAPAAPRAERSQPATRTPAGATAPPSRAESTALLLRAREGASSGASAAQEHATGFWGRMRATLGSIAAAFGMSTLALIALLFLLLAGLAMLIGWTMFRGQGKYSAKSARVETDDDLYAHNRRQTQGRRMVGDAAPRRRDAVQDQDQDQDQDIYEPEDDFRETMPEDFDAIFAEENNADDPMMRPAAASRDTKSKVAAEEHQTWRKPNLDRLRDSIKSDWMASKKSSARKSLPVAPDSAYADDPGERRMGEISDGWEEWDDQTKPADDPWGETLQEEKSAPGPADDDALRRIRALRQSLRAS